MAPTRAGTACRPGDPGVRQANVIDVTFQPSWTSLQCAIKRTVPYGAWFDEDHTQSFLSLRQKHAERGTELWASF